MESGREPNWRKWQNVTEITLLEGVALSLNIEPSRVNDRRQSFQSSYRIGYKGPFEENEQFLDRIFQIERNLGTSKGLAVAAVKVVPLDSMIQISAFAAWALSNDSDVPQEFASFAASEPVTPEFDKLSPTYPPELDLALQAWRAVSKSNDKGKPKARIRTWLDANTALSNEAKERIATVANWDKLGGATRTD